MRKVLFVALVLCVCCSFAAADTFTMRSAFDAAATTATFNNGVASTGWNWYPYGGTVDGIHFVGTWTGVYQEGQNSAGGYYSLDGTADMIAYVTALPRTATVTLPTGVTALGIDLGVTSAGTYQIVLSDGQVFLLALNQNTTFFGVTTSTPITSFQIGYVSYDGVASTVLFDNLTYGTAVPEPGGLLLLGSGLAGLLSTMRKKLRK